MGDFPIVALIDERSASAAEALAAALKENQKALVAGRASFGKGAVQSFFKLPRGYAVKLTSGEYRSPSGKAIQGQGVRPHITLPLRAKAGGEAKKAHQEPFKAEERKPAQKTACEKAAIAALQGKCCRKAADREREEAFQILKSFHKLKSACFSDKT